MAETSTKYRLSRKVCSFIILLGIIRQGNKFVFCREIKTVIVHFIKDLFDEKLKSACELVRNFVVFLFARFTFTERCMYDLF